MSAQVPARSRPAKAPLHRRLIRFRRDESGSISIEFLLWAPLLTYVGMAMFVLSYYLATVSEVQQVANEVARSSLRLVNVEQVNGNLCASMRESVLPRVVKRMAIVSESRFQPMQDGDCRHDADNFVTVEVTYDLTDTALNRLGRLLGFDLESVRRLSTVQM